jgi:hypothetical protein
LDAGVQYYLKQDASALSDQQWAEKITQLDYIRGLEKSQSEVKEWVI